MDRIIQHVRIKVRTVPIEKDRILANPPSNGRIIIPGALNKTYSRQNKVEAAVCEEERSFARGE